MHSQAGHVEEIPPKLLRHDAFKHLQRSMTSGTWLLPMLRLPTAYFLLQRSLEHNRVLDGLLGHNGAVILLCPMLPVTQIRSLCRKQFFARALGMRITELQCRAPAPPNQPYGDMSNLRHASSSNLRSYPVALASSDSFQHDSSWTLLNNMAPLSCSPTLWPPAAEGV